MEHVIARQYGKEFEENKTAFSTSESYDCPISGTIYGCLLNEEKSMKERTDLFSEKPYQALPNAPILYIKPENTKSGHLSEVALPAEESHVQVGGTLGIVIGKTATAISAEDALDYVHGYTIVSDLSLPHDSFFRPAVKYRALDRFNPAGPWIVKKETIHNPNQLTITTKFNDEEVFTFETKNLIRSVEQLLSDVTAFMTLQPGDCLLIGTPIDLPLAKKGDQIDIHIAEVGHLQHSIAQAQKEDSR